MRNSSALPQSNCSVAAVHGSTDSQYIRPPSVTLNNTIVDPTTAVFNLDNKQIHLDIKLDIRYVLLII